MKNKISDGTTISYTVIDTVVASGDVLNIGDMVGVAVTSGQVGETIAVSIEGVYAVPKGAGAIAQGKKVYFNPLDKNMVLTPTGNVLAGYAWENATAGNTSVLVKLSF